MADPEFTPQELKNLVLTALATPQGMLQDAKTIQRIVRSSVLPVPESLSRLRSRLSETPQGSPYHQSVRQQLAILQSNIPARVEHALQELFKEGRVSDVDGKFVLLPEWRRETVKPLRDSKVIRETLRLLEGRSVLPILEQDVLDAIRQRAHTPRRFPKILARSDLITPDKLRDFFTRHSYTDFYAHSVSYLRQSLRRLHYTGFSYFDGSTLILITTREKGKLPFVLVAPIGSRHVVEKTVRLSQLLSEFSGKPVIIKKMRSHDIRIARKRFGVKSYGPEEGWHPAYKHDDDTFPAPVLDVHKLARLEGKPYEELRRKRNHLYRSHTIEFIPFEPAQHQAMVRKLLRDWSVDLVARHPEENAAAAVRAYDPLIRKLPPGKPGKDFVALLMRVDGVPVGFSLAERTGRTSFGLYANIAHTQPWGVPQELMRATAEAVQKAGARFLNMGGSEFKSTHEYKQRFRPVHYEKTKHLVIRPKPRMRF